MSSRDKLCRLSVGMFLLGLFGCSTTAIHEREKLSHAAMKFDADGGFVAIRNKSEAAREGAFGGFGAATAGGCACQ